MARSRDPRDWDDDETVGAASRALVDAAAVLTRAMSLGAAAAGEQVSDTLSRTLKDASRELAEASAQLGRHAGERRRRAKVERTRADLLAAARRVFAAKGYEGAAVGDIAAEAGYTKGALYSNFDSKEAIFLEIARELTEQEAVETGGWTAADLRRHLAVRVPDDDLLTRMLLTLELYTYAVRHPEAQAELAPLARGSMDVLARLVHTARTGAPGEPARADRDTALGLAAVHLLAVVAGPLLGDADEVAGTADRLVQRLLAEG